MQEGFSASDNERHEGVLDIRTPKSENKEHLQLTPTVPRSEEVERYAEAQAAVSGAHAEMPGASEVEQIKEKVDGLRSIGYLIEEVLRAAS